MKLNLIPMTASNPSSFGMPACGHLEANAFGTATFGGFATTSVVRDRQVDTKGDMGLAIAYVPGTTAWSPPIS